MANQQRRPGPLLEICEQCGIRFELDGAPRRRSSIRLYCDPCRKVRHASRMRAVRRPGEVAGQSTLDMG